MIFNPFIQRIIASLCLAWAAIPTCLRELLPKPQQKRKLVLALSIIGLASGVYSAGFLLGAGLAENIVAPKPSTDLPDFSAEPKLAPLVDRSKELPANEIPTSWTGGMILPGTQQPVSMQSPKVLTGRVESFEDAMQIEMGDVDWYDWYLSARDYLTNMGGLDCQPGTPIKFHRNGLMEVLAPDMICQHSVMGKCFPLPKLTRLDAIILPVRRKVVPPASRDELYSHVKKMEP